MCFCPIGIPTCKLNDVLMKNIHGVKKLSFLFHFFFIGLKIRLFFFTFLFLRSFSWHKSFYFNLHFLQLPIIFFRFVRFIRFKSTNFFFKMMVITTRAKVGTAFLGVYEILKFFFFFFNDKEKWQYLCIFFLYHNLELAILNFISIVNGFKNF